MDINYSAAYSAGPDEILDILTNRAFLRDYAEELGVTSHEADVDIAGSTRTVTLHLVAPTDEIPTVFRSLVGPSITIVDERTWAPNTDGSYSGRIHVQATAKGRTATIHGQLQLAHTTNGTSQFSAQAGVDIRVRLLGALAKAAVTDLGKQTLQDESTVVQQWLKRNGSAG